MRSCLLRDAQGHMDYAKGAENGEPIGSGAIESTCLQFECRFRGRGYTGAPEGTMPSSRSTASGATQGGIDSFPIRR